MNIRPTISDYHKNTICINCGSKETYIRVRNGKGYHSWYNYKDGKICGKCHSKLVVNINRDRHKKYDGREIRFCGTNITLSFILPREKCEICGITRKESLIHRHHYFYCRIMIWACTISLCNSCHQKIDKTGKKYKKKNKNLEKIEKYF